MVAPFWPRTRAILARPRIAGSEVSSRSRKRIGGFRRIRATTEDSGGDGDSRTRGIDAAREYPAHRTATQSGSGENSRAAQAHRHDSIGRIIPRAARGLACGGVLGRPGIGVVLV